MKMTTKMHRLRNGTADLGCCLVLVANNLICNFGSSPSEMADRIMQL